MPANLENSAWPQDWKRSVFILTLKKGIAKDCTNYRTIALISHTSKEMLKILQARLHNPTDDSPPGSAIPVILQARTLEWVAISFSRGSSDPGIKP